MAGRGQAGPAESKRAIDGATNDGADVNAPGLQGVTALHIAAALNADDAVQELLRLGADVTVRSANDMNAPEARLPGG